MTFVYGPSGREVPFLEKVRQINWFFIFWITAIAAIGIAMLYSTATTPPGIDGEVRQGSFDPWASRQLIRFGVGLAAVIIIGLIDIRVWMSLAYPAYAVAFLLLVAVEFYGVTGMGASAGLKSRSSACACNPPKS